MQVEKIVPCEICSKPTTFVGTKRCDNCWEVEHRLTEYLKNPKGLEFVVTQCLTAYLSKTDG